MSPRCHRLGKGKPQIGVAGLGGGGSVQPRGLCGPLRDASRSCVGLDPAFAPGASSSSFRRAGSLRECFLAGPAQHTVAQTPLCGDSPLRSNSDRLLIPSSPGLLIFCLLPIKALARRRPGRALAVSSCGQEIFACVSTRGALAWISHQELGRAGLYPIVSQSRTARSLCGRKPRAARDAGSESAANPGLKPRPSLCD